jgi:REP element-mobilizing transposase RayT
MATIYRNQDIITHSVGGLDDHVHLLFRLPAPLALSKAVYLVKAFSSKWMKQFVNKFDWQAGYGAFSVSASQLPAVIRYIERQESYHRKVSFQQEYLTLLRKHGVEYDPRYVLG